MSDIEDLAETIKRVSDRWNEPLDEVHDIPQIVDAIIAAGFHRHRIITTAEELDKCPPGTAVIDSIGLYALVTVGHQVTSFGAVKLWPYEELLTFPVTVLFEGVGDE